MVQLSEKEAAREMLNDILRSGFSWMSLIDLLAALAKVGSEAMEENNNRERLVALLGELEAYLSDEISHFDRSNLEVAAYGVAALKRLNVVDISKQRDRQLLVRLIGGIMQQTNSVTHQYYKVTDFKPLFVLLQTYGVTMKQDKLMRNINERINTFRLQYGERISKEMEELMTPFYQRSFAKCGMKSPLPKNYL